MDHYMCLFESLEALAVHNWRQKAVTVVTNYFHIYPFQAQGRTNFLV